MDAFCSNCCINRKTLIGKGDHQITADIDLYQMNSRGYDFGNVLFLSNSTPFVIKNTSISHQYVDDKIVQKNLLVSGTEKRSQCMDMEISLTKAEFSTEGFVYLSGTLSDRYGHSPQPLHQVIACWELNGGECRKIVEPPLPVEIELTPIGIVRVFLRLTAEPGTNFHNSVELNFMTQDNIRLVRCYKFRSQDEDYLYLYPLLTQVKLCGEDAVFVARNDSMPHGYVPLFKVHYIEYTIPLDPNTRGQIRMCGLAACNYGTPFYFDKVIATYDIYGRIHIE